METKHQHWRTTIKRYVAKIRIVSNGGVGTNVGVVGKEIAHANIRGILNGAVAADVRVLTDGGSISNTGWLWVNVSMFSPTTAY